MQEKGEHLSELGSAAEESVTCAKVERQQIRTVNEISISCCSSEQRSQGLRGLYQVHSQITKRGFMKLDIDVPAVGSENQKELKS